MEAFGCVFQYPFHVLRQQGFPLKGRWNEAFFKNTNPIVLELGCGKGEYAVGMARRFKEKNFIGIDIKGARMWSGASRVAEEGLRNVAFVRTSIELIASFFNPGEVAEIWITFPDPQMKKVRKRLISTRFLQLYRQILKPDGIIHLKTDSPFLYTYTRELIRANGIVPVADTSDLYHSDCADDVLEIRTFYEQQWLDRGLTIKYISFPLDHSSELREPEVEIEFDTYRSFSRGQIQCTDVCSPAVVFNDNDNKE